MQKEFEIKNRFNLISAVDENYCIGFFENDCHNLCYKISEDLIRFRQLTKFGIVIMGYNTFKEIGKPLPMRINIVISKNHYITNSEIDKLNLSPDTRLIFVKSLEEAIIKSEQFTNFIPRFIIGGEKVFTDFLNNYGKYIDTIYLTEIFERYSNPNPNAKLSYFPKFDKTKYKIKKLTRENHVNYEFVDYIKIQN
jgi:dihydrofolate reductase